MVGRFQLLNLPFENFLIRIVNNFQIPRSNQSNVSLCTYCIALGTSIVILKPFVDATLAKQMTARERAQSMCAGIGPVFITYHANVIGRLGRVDFAMFNTVP